MTTRATAILVIALMVGSGVQSTARPRYRTRSKQIGPGLTFKKITDRRGPNRIRVLVMNPKSRFTLDVGLGTEELPGHETTSSTARRHRAIAAINGDFTLRPGAVGSGRPVNIFVEDGDAHATPLIWGRNFSISRDETKSSIGHTVLKSWLNQTSQERWRIAAVNPVNPAAEGYTLYTPAGGRLFRPPPDSCGARLVAPSRYRWNAGADGVSADFVVEEVICRQRRIKRAGDSVITTPRSSYEAFEMQTSLEIGEVVSYEWSMKRPGALDTIGGNPDLLQNGRIVLAPCGQSYFCDRNPRTGVGIRGDGKILLVTVDGRSKSSVGMTLHGFARLFQYLGAKSALNLDGGGSTTMVVRDRIVNVPSDGFERPVGSSLLVLAGPDTGEAEPAPNPPARTSGGDDVRRFLPRAAFTEDAACLALRDPGSTGGMLDAMEKGLLGSPAKLPAEARSALRVFRGSAVCR